MVESRVISAIFGIFLANVSWAAQPRSMAERAAFHRANPCPETGQRRGSCAGWEIDHVTALCLGGPDTRANMQWLTVQAHLVKSKTDRRECRVKRAAEIAP